MPNGSTLLLALSLGALTPDVATGQVPRVGIIDVYGARRLPEVRVREAAGLAVGDTLDAASVTRARRGLASLPGVTASGVGVVCCEAGRTIVYLGIAEGSSSLTFHPAPAGAVRLRDEVVDAGTALLAAQESAALRGVTEEDDSDGHALVKDSAARAIQERFIGFATRDYALLRDVLRNSGDAAQRALAAQVIAYAADKPAVVPELLHAMRDPDPTVRNNATRALGLIASLAQRRPELGIRVPAEPFIDLLRSVVWTDRNKSALVMMRLTQSRDSTLLATLRARAMPEIVEMARWKAPGHAMLSFIIIGRIAGLPEAEIFAAFERGERERVIERAKSVRAR